MRKYWFLSGDPNKLAGWTFYTNRGDGHPFELMPEGMREGDAFPEHTILCDRVGDCYQLTCLSNSEEQRASLEAQLTAAASKAGLSLFDSAKSFAATQPAIADAYLYAQEPTGETKLAVDDEGEVMLDEKGAAIVVPTGVTRKVEGAPLQVACCLAGDDAVAAADPTKVGALLEQPLESPPTEAPTSWEKLR